jgi:2-polyprenyl-3-methyl-5-hydroxy-6-metoxy-1,4-benzoquinol methylase
MNAHAGEVSRGERFEFGANWRRFLESLTEERIQLAERSLRENLGELAGKRFLDIGSGSGLFSLAAHRLGANVHSFDFDPQSVACTQELKRRFGTGREWKIEEGSALDADYLASLGSFDIVYSWGVLHHTGAMWRALENAIGLVAPGGSLFIAIYNDEGYKSRYWRRVKRLYVSQPLLRPLIVATHGLWISRWVFFDMLRGKLFKDQRGMKLWTDIIDWLGGYPFEVATPQAIFAFFKQRGFTLETLITRRGFGCNEFGFTKKA